MIVKEYLTNAQEIECEEWLDGTRVWEQYMEAAMEEDDDSRSKARRSAPNSRSSANVARRSTIRSG